MATPSYKDEGNRLFNDKDYVGAIEMYTKAINTDPQAHVLYSNRSVAYLHNGDHSSALQDANTCVQLMPEWFKAHARRGAALEALGAISTAIDAYETALELNPNNDEITKKLKALKQRLAGSAAGTSAPVTTSATTSSAKPKPATKKQAAPKQKPAGMFGNLYSDSQQQASSSTAQQSKNGHNGPQHQQSTAPTKKLPVPQAWAEGLSSQEQWEFLVDTYRMRVDDTYVYRSASVGLYKESSKRDKVENVLLHFLVFCKLAVLNKVLPDKWSWKGFLQKAGELLMHAFDKTKAHDKFGAENVFTALFGGRSCRYTGEMVYGSSVLDTKGTKEERHLTRMIGKEWEFVLHQAKTASDEGQFSDVGGRILWEKLEKKLRDVESSM